MKTALQIIIIASAAFLTLVILLQNQGSGLGVAFGGGDGGFYRTKRGAERVLFTLTILLAIIFVATTIGLVIVK